MQGWRSRSQRPTTTTSSLVLIPINLTSATNIKPTDTPTRRKHQPQILFFVCFLLLPTKLTRSTGKSWSKGYGNSRTHFEQSAPCGQQYDGEGENSTYKPCPTSPIRRRHRLRQFFHNQTITRKQNHHSPKPGTSARYFRALFPQQNLSTKDKEKEKSAEHIYLLTFISRFTVPEKDPNSLTFPTTSI